MEIEAGGEARKGKDYEVRNRKKNAWVSEEERRGEMSS